MKRRIIGCLLPALLCLLSGCNAIRLSYNNGPQLGWWWLDGYVDFAPEQAPVARAAIERWFEWHRATQLLPYADQLAAARAQVAEPLTPALACRWNERLREALDPALERALQDGADLLPGLREPQFRAIEKRYAKVIAEMRDDYLQDSTAARRRASVKRTVAWMERLYGSVDEAQRKLIAASVAASPFDPERWLAERQRMQRETVQTLRRLAAERADRDQRIAALRMLMQRAEQSPDLDYRAYRQRLVDFNCAFAAQLHNAISPAQRQHAREALQGWEDDLRALAAGPAPGDASRQRQDVPNNGN
ncbi:DUF6279 family lipoprotein [Rubrivivax sp. A210]|uniref:DUF6279 family lipoprotein n=1 Tax=Rubrivivax sp. A210 TaxID=2772301 RepID=UPI001F1BC3B6|nr:DUF6279 family lipoprotein [Rubrivivax sp. A210]